MEFKFKGIGKIPESTLRVNGLTIIAGVNGVGKSTLLKAIYSVLSPYVNFTKKVREDVSNYAIAKFESALNNSKSVEYEKNRLEHILYYDNEIEDLNKGSLEDMFALLHKLGEKHNLSFEAENISNEIKKLLNRENQFLNEFTSRFLSEEFYSPTQTRYFDLDDNEDAIISLIADDKKIETRIRADGSIICLGDRPVIPDVHYYDSPFLMDSIYPRYRGNDHRSSLYKCVHTPMNTSISESVLNADALIQFQNKVDSILKGDLIRDRTGMFLIDEKGRRIHTKNVAAGMKIFGILSLLMKNGHLKNGTILLLDEPEIHIHPSWMSALSEIILLLAHEFGIKIVVSTHNPQLLLGIETYSIKYNQKTDYYHLKNNNGQSSLDDVSDDVDSLYAELAKPLEKANEEYWRALNEWHVDE